jgi:hypothetical protein
MSVDKSCLMFANAAYSDGLSEIKQKSKSDTLSTFIEEIKNVTVNTGHKISLVKLDDEE